jgi:hypothetical protein
MLSGQSQIPTVAIWLPDRQSERQVGGHTATYGLVARPQSCLTTGGGTMRPLSVRFKFMLDDWIAAFRQRVARRCNERMAERYSDRSVQATPAAPGSCSRSSHEEPLNESAAGWEGGASAYDAYHATNQLR